MLKRPSIEIQLPISIETDVELSKISECLSDIPIINSSIRKRKSNFCKKMLLELNKKNICKWLIVFGSFLVYFIADGVSLSFGIFTREFIAYFDQEDNQKFAFVTTALIQSVPLFLSPLVCLLIEQFNCRKIAFLGSTLLFLSFILARYFVNSLLSLNLIIGMMTSCGLAMVYIPAYLIISFHFEKHRALATGLAVSGSGLGLFVMSPLAEYLISEFGWRDACFLFGAISSHTFISACLFHTNDDKNDKQLIIMDTLKTERTHEQEISAINKSFSFKFNIFLYEIMRIYREKNFIVLNLSYFILSFAVVAPYNFLPSHIKHNKIEDPNSISLSLIGLSTLAGQIFIGFLSDIYRKHNWFIYAMSTIIAGISTVLVPYISDIKFIYMYSIVFGFMTSANYVLQSSLVIESLGLANLTLAFGCIQLCQAFSTLFGTPLLGWVKDYTQNYDNTFFISGVLMTSSGLIIMLWPIRVKKIFHKFNKEETGRFP
jgi:MCP family monocarboxylic acid transporter-like MFS transporter 12